MTEQLGLEGMPRRLFVCTPSRLTAWLDCPRRYRLTDLDRPAPPRGGPWGHNTVGATVHLALARWWSEPLDRRTPVGARALLDRAWTQDGRSVLTTDDARGSLALALHALAAGRTLRRTCTRVELHHLPTGAVAGFDHTDASLARHLSRAEAIGEEAVAAAETLLAGGDPDELFPARPGRLCGWCDVARPCPAAACAPLRPWEGLAPEPEAA